jgi:hypothetical protein
MSDMDDMSASEKKKEDWMNAKWRPMMGWMYMAVCACDFMLFPILWSLHQAINHGQVNSQWQPLTLQGAGLFHIAMGAVLGIAAYGRTKEKMAGAENGGLSQGFGPGAGTQYVPPGGMGMNSGMGGMNSGMSGGFNNGNGFNSGSSMSGGSTYGAPSTGGFGSPAFGSSPAPAFGSTPAPAFGTLPTLTTTPPATSGKPSGPAQSFPAL